MNSCTLNVKTLAGNEAQAEKLHLDDAFFEGLNSPELLGGSVDVTVKSDKYDSSNRYKVSMNIDGVVKIPCNRCLAEMELEIHLCDSFTVNVGGYAQNDDDESDEQQASASGEYNAAERIVETILLNIPIAHNHPEGLCDENMVEKLGEHSGN